MNDKKPRRMHLNERILRVPIHIYDERVAKCKQCYAYQEDGQVCKIVMNPISTRTVFKAGSCPMGFWSSNYGN